MMSWKAKKLVLPVPPLKRLFMRFALKSATQTKPRNNVRVAVIVAVIEKLRLPALQVGYQELKN